MKNVVIIIARTLSTLGKQAIIFIFAAVFMMYLLIRRALRLFGFWSFEPQISYSFPFFFLFGRLARKQRDEDFECVAKSQRLLARCNRNGVAAAGRDEGPNRRLCASLSNADDSARRRRVSVINFQICSSFSK